jgi:hypothetical protein
MDGSTQTNAPSVRFDSQDEVAVGLLGIVASSEVVDASGASGNQ